ncbi:MAG: hypothetical protein ACOYD4_13830 [Solirubrobacterales bacterium]
MPIRRERVVLLGICGLAAVACVLGAAARPSAGYLTGNWDQALQLIRVGTTACLALTLLMGPGLLWRAGSSKRQPTLGFMLLPGLALLGVTGALAWLLADTVDPRLTCFVLAAPAIGFVIGALIGADPEDLFDGEEHRVLLVVGCALGFAIARALWSLGPEGELYAGTISRTLEVGDRSDSRISFIIPQLATHGIAPYSEEGAAYFLPYNFSSRGPLAGLASEPVIMLSGGTPPIGIAEQPWQPFDPQGFMAYRLAMMTMACTAFLSIWDLARRLGGAATGWVALLLAVTTPFLIHEVWFTWPKLLGASLVVLGAICIVERKSFRSGLLVGVGYLMHPGALLPLAGISLVALWPLKGANWRRPDIRALALLAAGVAISVVAWRLFNGSHYSQNEFVEYLTSNGTEPNPPFLRWLGYRATSLGNTLVPMLLPFANTHDHTLNVVEGTSPFAIHFFFQYWNTLPFGIGIAFFPFLLISLWRAFRRWRWPVTAAVIAPFAAFAVYWGGSRTGMLREGLHTWVLVVIAVVALQQWSAGFPWFKSKWMRGLLALRTVELLAVALGPGLTTTHVLIGSTFALTDTIALLGMLGFAAILARTIWVARPQDEAGERST